MGHPKEARPLPIVAPEFSQHVLRADGVIVVVGQALMLGDIHDGLAGCGADLARPFRDIVGHREYLVGLLVQEQVIVPECTARHVPVKVLGLDIEREYICEEMTQLLRDLSDRLSPEIRSGYARALPRVVSMAGFEFRHSGFVPFVWVAMHGNPSLGWPGPPSS